MWFGGQSSVSQIIRLCWVPNITAWGSAGGNSEYTLYNVSLRTSKHLLVLCLGSGHKSKPKSQPVHIGNIFQGSLTSTNYNSLTQL